MHALPLASLPAVERAVLALFETPERCRRWSRRFWFPWEGDWRVRSAGRVLRLRTFGLGVALGLSSLRWAEVVRLRVGDVFGDSVHVPSCKGGSPRNVPVGTRWASVALALCEGRPLSALFLVSSAGAALDQRNFDELVYELTSQFCGRRYSWHSLRHTAALRCYVETRDPLAVQRLLGHRSLRHTVAYLSQIEVLPWAGVPLFDDRPRLSVFHGDGPPPALRGG